MNYDLIMHLVLLLCKKSTRHKNWTLHTQNIMRFLLMRRGKCVAILKYWFYSFSQNLHRPFICLSRCPSVCLSVCCASVYKKDLNLNRAEREAHIEKPQNNNFEQSMQNVAQRRSIRDEREAQPRSTRDERGGKRRATRDERGAKRRVKKQSYRTFTRSPIYIFN